MRKMGYDVLFKKPTSDVEAFVTAWTERREGGGLELGGWHFLVTSSDGHYVLSYREIAGMLQKEGVPERIAEALGFPPEGRQGYYWFMQPN